MRAFALLPLLMVVLNANTALAQPAAARYQLVLQTPPATGVTGVDVSPDGSLVATAGGEGGVRIHDAQTGKLLRVIGEAGDRSVHFSPDGKTLTAAGFHMDKLFGVYDVHTGKRLHALAGHTEWEVYASARSPDGKLLASAGTDKQILVWDLATGKLLHQFKDQPLVASALAFSPDSKILASGGGDKKVHLWDMASGKLRKSLTGHDEWIAMLAFSPDGKTLASGGCDWGFHRGHDWPRAASRGPEQSEWRLWNVETGEVKRTQSIRGRMLALAIAPDGKSVAFGRDNDVFVLSDDTAGRYGSHYGIVTSVAFTPDGRSLITGSHDQTTRRIDLATGKTDWEAPGYFEQVNSVALSGDAALLATGSSDHRFARGKLRAGSKELGPGALRLWNARTGRLLWSADDSDQFMAIAISSDGKYVAAGGGLDAGKGVVRLYDAKTGDTVWSSKDHVQEVLALAFAPDGSSLAIGSADGVVKVANSRTGEVSRTLADHKGGATSVAYSPDGKSLICGEALGGARIWDVNSGRLIKSCMTPDSAAKLFARERAAYSLNPDRMMNSMGLNRDGSLLALCGSSINNEFVDAVRLWDPRSGTITRDFSAEKIHGRPMALSPDGSILATGGKSVQIWDARTGKKLQQLFGHLKRTQSIVFSADGKTIVAGGSWGTTNIWDVATGKHLVTLFAFRERGDKAANDHWFAYHPEGYYVGSPGVERYLAWRVGEELLTPATLSAELNRPELLKLAP